MSLLYNGYRRVKSAGIWSYIFSADVNTSIVISTPIYTLLEEGTLQAQRDHSNVSGNPNAGNLGCLGESTYVDGLKAVSAAFKLPCIIEVLTLSMLLSRYLV